MITRVSALGAAVTAVLLATASGASAAGSTLLAEASPLDKISTPVGLTAVGLGLAGMVAGVFRKKKVQPENQRKS
ncbi:hypothetical protein [Saccharopolyspora sp. 5N708]|uniref:hypothetical protein n=1 Tax=Saccharopolyspora sp. 5N708 TaxID=3457424 RepID=UPI003FD1A9AD